MIREPRRARQAARRWQATFDVSNDAIFLLDREQRVLLANLATNARDAIAKVETIPIDTSNVTLDESDRRAHPALVPGEFVLLTFSHSGVGMGTATRERIFEQFFTTRPQGQGTGLGLATVYGIVKQNGRLTPGRAGAAGRSHPGRGTPVPQATRLRLYSSGESGRPTGGGAR